MKKILVLSGSNSEKSINRALAEYAGGEVSEAEIITLDIGNFEMELFSPKREETSGVPELALKFLSIIESCDGIIISMPEHNGSYPAAFKNLYDWASRSKKEVWSAKPMLLMSTSPGPRGGATVLAAATQTFPRMGANLTATFSLPSFYENFSKEVGIISKELRADFLNALEAFKKAF